MSDEERLIGAALDPRVEVEQHDAAGGRDTQAAPGSHVPRPPTAGGEASARDRSPMPFVTYLCDKKNVPDHWCCKLLSTGLTVATFLMLAVLIVWVCYTGERMGRASSDSPGNHGNHSRVQTTPTTPRTGCCPMAYSNHGNHEHDQGGNWPRSDVILGRWARQAGGADETSLTYNEPLLNLGTGITVITPEAPITLRIQDKLSTNNDTTPEPSIKAEGSTLWYITQEGDTTVAPEPGMETTPDPPATTSSSATIIDNTTTAPGPEEKTPGPSTTHSAATTVDSKTKAKEAQEHQILSMVLPVVGALCLVGVIVCVCKVVVCSGIYAHCEPEESLCHRALTWCNNACCSQHKLWTLEDDPRCLQDDTQKYEVRLNRTDNPYTEMI